MPLRPDDVVRKSFSTAILRRGYDEKQVDAFLEEVVGELRRLYGRIDELQAETASLAARTPADEMSERVQREQQQVDLIRAERRDLVSELATVQNRLDTSVQEAEAAVARAAEAEGAAGQAEARHHETQGALQVAEEQLLRAQAEYDEAVAAQDRVAVELRTLRVAAQEHAAQILPDLELPAEESPAADLKAILLVARALHDDYVDSGRAQGQRLRDEATASAEQLLAGAQEQVDQLVRAAQTEHDRLLAHGQGEHERLTSEAQAQHAELVQSGQAEHDQLVQSGQAEHDQLVQNGQAEHDRLISQAEEQRAGILADLNARREMLEARVTDLDKGQAEYRERLRTLVRQQLAALEDDTWRT